MRMKPGTPVRYYMLALTAQLNVAEVLCSEIKLKTQVDMTHKASRVTTPAINPPSSTTLISFNIAAQAPLKLTSNNYSDWLIQFCSLLIGYDLLGFVDGFKTCPPPTLTTDNVQVPNPAYSLWIWQDQLLLNAIISALSPTLIPFIASSSTSLEAWSMLAKTYASPSWGRIMQLKAQLSHPVKGTKSITEFLQGIKAHVDALALMGVSVDAEDLTLKILNVLDDTYKELSLEAQLLVSTLKPNSWSPSKSPPVQPLPFLHIATNDLHPLAPHGQPLHLVRGTITLLPLGILVKDLSTGNLLLTCPCNQGVYVWPHSTLCPPSPSAYQAMSESTLLCHARLGHPSSDILRHLVSSKLVESVFPYSTTTTLSNLPATDSHADVVASSSLVPPTLEVPIIPPVVPSPETPPITRPLTPPVPTAPPPPHPMTTRSRNHIIKPNPKYSLNTTTSLVDQEPTCVTTALRDYCWRTAMSEEFDALLCNGTWDLVPPHHSHKLVGCKWVFRIKRASDGQVNRFKARLVAKGFHQRPGIDFSDTFSPVVKPTTIRVILSLAVQRGWPLRQLDVNNAFIQGSLEDENAKPVHTPLTTSSTLFVYDGTPLADATAYRQVIGSLQYLLLTRPNIAFAVNRLSQFMCAPSEHHWGAVKRLLRYLNGTIQYGLHLRPSDSISLHGFTDSDWAGNPDDKCSTAAYIMFLGPNPVSWISKKQRTVARSSTEVEYRAIAIGAAEISWLCSLLSELGITLPSTPVIYSDNIGATYLCANRIFHSRMKHIALDYHFVRDLVQRACLRVSHVSSADQLADALTKPLSSARLRQLIHKIGVSLEPPS
ncbi:uncharacterized protein [Henckelia pumila]|uniref:uncharacterized protein n=1 Tax=Henckelia pumila TaxID=405737 RepID=UPI003C6DE163